MNPNRFYEVVEKYRALLDDRKAEAAYYPPDSLLRHPAAGMNQCLMVLEDLSSTFDARRVDHRTMEELVFVQGCLFMRCLLTLADAKNDCVYIYDE